MPNSIETALTLAEGLAVAENADTGERTVFSSRFACPVSGFTIEEIEPRLFSFNAPQGACPACDGLGVKMFFDPEMVVPDDRLSLAEGAVAPWADSSGQYYLQTLESIAKHYKVKMSTPWQRPAQEGARRDPERHAAANSIAMRYDDGIRQYQTTKPFEGVIPNLDRRWKETELLVGARGPRALPARGQVRDLQRRAAQARGAGGQDRRAEHQPGHRVLDRRLR